jgi:hypothetical protein
MDYAAMQHFIAMQQEPSWLGTKRRRHGEKPRQSVNN